MLGVFGLRVAVGGKGGNATQSACALPALCVFGSSNVAYEVHLVCRDNSSPPPPRLVPGRGSENLEYGAWEA